MCPMYIYVQLGNARWSVQLQMRRRHACPACFSAPQRFARIHLYCIYISYTILYAYTRNSCVFTGYYRMCLSREINFAGVQNRNETKNKIKTVLIYACRAKEREKLNEYNIEKK